MLFPYFNFFTFYSAALCLLSCLAIGKVITQNWKLNLKENIFIILATLVGAVISALHRDFNNFFFLMLRDAFLFIMLLFYFYKVKMYSFKKAVFLMLASSYIFAASIHITTTLFYDLVPSFNSQFIPRVNPANDMVVSWPEFLHISLLLPFSVIVTYVLVKILRKLRVVVNQSGFLQNIFVSVGTVTVLSILIGLSYMRYNKISFHFTESIFAPYDMMLFALIIVFYFLVVYFYNRHKIQLREEQYQALQHYTRELEQQQSAVRKFKHDYQNILLSLDSFIREKKWDDLEEYYETKIKVASDVITDNEFALEALSKIKINEIKSLFTAKLMVAQSMGIDATFEAHEEIENIPMDSVSLVRMLGIILDNAIEELTELGDGKLRVAYFRDGEEIIFIVQNTCRPGLKLGEVEQPGYSTKGKGRGQGLDILSELANSFPNITREMGIWEETFTQRLAIKTEEEM